MALIRCLEIYRPGPAGLLAIVGRPSQYAAVCADVCGSERGERRTALRQADCHATASASAACVRVGVPAVGIDDAVARKCGRCQVDRPAGSAAGPIAYIRPASTFGGDDSVVRQRTADRHNHGAAARVTAIRPAAAVAHGAGDRAISRSSRARLVSPTAFAAMPGPAPAVAGTRTLSSAVASFRHVNRAARVDRETAGDGHIELVGFGAAAGIVRQDAARADRQVRCHGIQVCPPLGNRPRKRVGRRPGDGTVAVSDEDSGGDVAERAVAVQRAAGQVQHAVGAGRERTEVGRRDAVEPIRGVCERRYGVPVHANVPDNQVPVGLGFRLEVHRARRAVIAAGCRAADTADRGNVRGRK